MTWTDPARVAAFLLKRHYLGPITRGEAWRDDYGVIVVTNPTARRLPPEYLELARWCIASDVPNAGSRQWAAFVRALRIARPEATTIVSYSDPSVGHDGALYRACNWWWAPTWHRFRPPPSGNGSWDGTRQSVKDRWIFPLRPDPSRVDILTMKDNALLRKYPDARYCEPGGVPYKRFAPLLQAL